VEVVQEIGHEAAHVPGELSVEPHNQVLCRPPLRPFAFAFAFAFTAAAGMAESGTELVEALRDKGGLGAHEAFEERFDRFFVALVPSVGQEAIDVLLFYLSTKMLSSQVFFINYYCSCIIIIIIPLIL
jgi:hypothetical protein